MKKNFARKIQQFFELWIECVKEALDEMIKQGQLTPLSIQNKGLKL